MEVKHKHKEGVMVVLENNELKIKSIELVKLINDFRKLESEITNSNYVELQHKSFIAKIKNELKALELLGLGGEQNILPGSYIDKQNQERPCYELNRDGMLQMLNSESILVRYKTIEYINKLEEELNKPKVPTTYKEALLQLIEAEEEKERLELENKEQKKQLDEAKPKVSYYDLILQSDQLLSVTSIAKDYGVGAQTLNNLLNKLGIQYKQGNQWLLYSKYQDKEYTFSKTNNYVKSDGRLGSSSHTYWTQKGRKFIYDKLKKNGILPTIEREAV